MQEKLGFFGSKCFCLPSENIQIPKCSREVAPTKGSFVSLTLKHFLDQHRVEPTKSCFTATHASHWAKWRVKQVSSQSEPLR